MYKLCDSCGEPLMKGESVAFIGAAEFDPTSSPVSFAIKEDFRVVEVYHEECLYYIMNDRGDE